MIGIILMVFQIAGSKLQSSTYDSTTNSFVNTTTARVVNTTGAYVSTYTNANYRNCALTISIVTNKSDGVVISAGNYSVSGCLINGSTASAPFVNQLWNVTGSYTYDADNSATSSINETQVALRGATDFFPTFVTLGAMVVLILLVVIIINSIRATGVTNEGA